jgi:hypothetical protein
MAVSYMYPDLGQVPERGQKSNSSETPRAGTLTQRHARLIGIEIRRVESVGRGAHRWHLKRKGR